jgi:hypothetical protein
MAGSAVDSALGHSSISAFRLPKDITRIPRRLLPSPQGVTMTKRNKSVVKTTFERIPVALAKKIAELEVQQATAGLAFCAVCGGAVPLERCKTDEFGKAVHQNCYMSALKQTAKKTMSAQLR